MNYFFIKGVVDKIFAFFTLIFFLPIMLFISLSIYFSMGSPIFYIQQRTGIRLRLFYLFKFRTMKNNIDLNGTDFQRITYLGHFLRSSSLDELPQLINILKGDMSFVGPRPLLKEYIDLYSPHQNKRHKVMPGLTGFAQVKGRNSISWEDKFEYDIYYVNKQSFLFDLYILFKTILIVILKVGISHKNDTTMPKFKG